MILPRESRTSGTPLALAIGVFLSCAALRQVDAESELPSPPVAGDAETAFTPEERAKLRVALSIILNDPDVTASRNRARSAMETYKAQLREAVKRASPELGEKVEKMLVERLTKSDKDLFLIRFRSLFKPMKEVPQFLRDRTRTLFAELTADPEMERLRKASLKTHDVPGRSKIYGAMRARIAEVIEENDPAIFEALQPLPGTAPHDASDAPVKTPQIDPIE